MDLPGPLALVAMTVFIAIGGELVRLLWNWLLPTLFGWRQISFCRLSACWLFAGFVRRLWCSRRSLQCSGTNGRPLWTDDA